MKNIHTIQRTRPIALALLGVFVTNLFLPLMLPAPVYAGGPTQPEVQGFTPIGMTDMVDPFSGDFTYNIPLMDVEGYPINIAYHSGISMDQEASWVGLGWALNMGSINRGMRGLPDDFDGDVVKKTQITKPNLNIGLDFGASLELFSALGISASAAIDWSNYKGFATSLSVSPSVKFGEQDGLSGTAGFALSGSSENGASFSPSFSLSQTMKGPVDADTKLGLNIGSSFNSRAGLQGISYGATLSRQLYTTKEIVTPSGEKKTVKDEKNGHASSGIGGSYDIGLHTYTPTSGQSMRGVSFAGNVNLGGTAFAADPSFKIGISFSSNWVPDDLKTISSPSYGYFNLQDGQNKDNALLDFNRDNDGSFTKYSVNLPTAYLQPDIFSVAAQGVGGSFRAYRNDIGYVFDPEVTSFFDAGNLSLEFGLGNLADFGGDVAYNNTASRSGAWRDMNDAANYLKFSNLSSSIGSYTLQEASEGSEDADQLMPVLLRGSNPVALKMGSVRGAAQVYLHLNSSFISPGGNGSLSQTARSLRRKTNEALYFLTVGDVQAGMGINAAPDMYAGAKAHHIGEITQLGMDGRRYVFGIPAYNHVQRDVTFAMGSSLYSGPTSGFSDHEGTIAYDPSSDATASNSKGIDHYYQVTETPAYAHSFMLTSVLSDDYSDVDNVQGPSVGDFGSYVNFSYTKVDEHKWRTPVEENVAYYNEGLKTDPSDDKASYVYGEKDLWYVTMVETKNYVAVFELENREDAYPVLGEHGGLDAAHPEKAMKSLKKISLYSRAEYQANISDLSQAIPLQEVHFEYNYDLCQGYPGNSGGDGKLTLTKIWFSYQHSNKMARRSYKFQYNGLNPDYDLKACDRWGTYSPLTGTGGDVPNGVFTNSDFPYTNQDTTFANQYASAWCLTDIELPSGGKISVDYEADDYAFVQHKKAAKMFQIISMGDSNTPDDSGMSGTPALHVVSDDSHRNRQLFFKFDDVNDRVEDYFGTTPGSTSPVQIYFRVLMEFKPGASTTSKGGFEYVSGYGNVTNVSTVTIGGEKYGAFYLQPAKMKDNGPSDFNPMTKTGILLGRMHMSGFIYDNPSLQPSGTGASAITDFATSVINSIESFSELITGPNMHVYDLGKCQKIMVNKSFIRLFEPNGVKIGGGARVKRIRMNDNWNTMDTGSSAYEYGQEFSYKYEDGTSSGVASYEPQLGGDENPFHTADIVNTELRFQPDNNLIIENPIMESQFPSPGVGYARVEIKDLPRAGVTRTATGKVVKEFYTARDFPTIVRKTAIIDPAVSEKKAKFGPSYTYMDASQGFTLELNDMHGKAKSESVYAEGATAPLSTVKYEYQCEPLNLDGVNNFHLTSSAKVLSSNGTQSTADIGVHYDMTADFRESETKSVGGSMNLNLNAMFFGFFPLALPIAFPKVNMSHERFRSATLTKIVQRFGILTKTTANQDGSIVETNNLSYDAETGQVLSTQTTTDFNDKVYSLTYPAHWKYASLGGAYKNIGYKTSLTLDASGYATVAASSPFLPGDELMVTTSSDSIKGWVTEKNNTSVRVLNKQGLPFSGAVTVKIIRSGYRNKQQTSMASITSLMNPEPGVLSGSYQKVLNAGAVEFSDNWKTACNCFAAVNPYVGGMQGNWRPSRSFTHLSGRTQSNYDLNTDIRRDGIFTSYNPYYFLNNGSWDINTSNWTYVSEVTEFSPNGMTLETRDALGRYSASVFDFHQTLTTAVGANMSMKELSVQSFENPLAAQNCDDQGFLKPISDWDVSDERAHSGKYSLKISANDTLAVTTKPNYCPQASACPDIQFDQKEMLFTGGTYTMDFDVIFGDVYAEYADSRIQLVGNFSSDFEIRVTARNAEGCVWHLKIVDGPFGYVISTID